MQRSSGMDLASGEGNMEGSSRAPAALASSQLVYQRCLSRTFHSCLPAPGAGPRAGEVDQPRRPKAGTNPAGLKAAAGLALHTTSNLPPPHTHTHKTMAPSHLAGA